MNKRKRPSFYGITVDDYHSRDLDDGFWIENTQESHIILRVFVSNVSSRVHPSAPNKHLYEMAHSRVETEYYWKSITPMLPFSISENSSSLVPNEKRQAICFEFHITKAGFEIIHFSFFECIFTSIRKMNYTEVHNFLTGQPIELPENIQQVISVASSLSSAFMSRRRDRGALVVYDTFHSFTVNEEGRLVSIPKDRHQGYILIQELMILVNSQVADFAVKRNIPVIFRVHQARNEHFSKEDVLREYSLLQLNRDPATFQMLQYRLDHILQPAVYQPKHGEHWGLSLPWYLHATSPIRRFADLVNQVNLVAFTREQEYPFSYEELGNVSTHINDTILAHKERRKERAKAAAIESLPEDMTKEWLSDLTTSDFTRNLKLVCKSEGALKPVFVEEILRRIEQDILQPLDYCFILFNERMKQYEGLKNAVLELFFKNPVKIKPICHVYCQRNSLMMPALESKKLGEMFVSKLTFTFQGIEYSAISPTASSKKTASENAYLLLFCKMFGREDLKPFKAGEVFAVKGKTPDFALLEASNDNFIQTLQESAQKAQVAFPFYKFTNISGGFNCKVSLSVKGKQYASTGSGLNKKIAKHTAAKMLYEQLSSISQ